jgi:serine protease AprX
LDPRAPSLRTFGLEQDDASSSNYILIQVSGPLKKEQKQELKDKEVKILEYVSDDTYLCGYKVRGQCCRSCFFWTLLIQP